MTIVPIGRAISWELWKKNRPAILVSLAAIPVCSLLLGVVFPEGAEDRLFVLSYYPLGIAIFHAMYLFTYGETDAKKSLAGYPARTYLLPVRTSVLVGWPMLLGGLITPMLYIAWALCVFSPHGVDLPLWWVALLIATAVACFQTIGWTLGGYRTVRLIAYVIVMTALVGAGVLASGVLPLELPVKPILAVTLPLVIVGAYFLSVIGVAANRRGDWPRERARRAAQDRVLSGLRVVKSRAPFRSRARAQLWFEWRQNGFLIPIYVGIMLALLLLAGADGLPAEGFWQFLVLLVTLTPFVAALGGPSWARSDGWSSDSSLSHFIATRPLSCATLANVKLCALVGSIMLAWAMIAAVGPLWVHLSGHCGSISRAMGACSGTQRVWLPVWWSRPCCGPARFWPRSA